MHKRCRYCNNVLTSLNAIRKIRGGEDLSDKCRACLIKILNKVKEKKELQKSFYDRIKKRVKVFINRVSDSLARLER